ncbi:MAG: hypothetical protein OEL53_07295 [Rhodospirillales bacterium]|nr:hypothetical protein [Rhodospirillales bacterium]
MNTSSSRFKKSSPLSPHILLITASPFPQPAPHAHTNAAKYTCIFMAQHKIVRCSSCIGHRNA